MELGVISDNTEAGRTASYGSKKKRRRLAAIDSSPHETEYSNHDSDNDEHLSWPRKVWPRKVHKTARVSVAPLNLPRSQYRGWHAPWKLRSERDALAEFGFESITLHDRDEYHEVVLDDFVIYRPSTLTRHPHELTALDQLGRRYCPLLEFDGTLRTKNARYSVQGVPFETVSIADYDAVDSPIQIYIETLTSRSKRVWYVLGRPAFDYTRFWNPFCWLARFSLYFVDFMQHHENTGLYTFRKVFHQYLIERHGSSVYYQQWHAEARLTDFRTTVNANAEFLFKECYGLDPGLEDHHLWDEVHPDRLCAVPQQPNNEEQTVVTPFAYSMFQHMYFADQLSEQRIASTSILKAVEDRKSLMGLTPNLGIREHARAHAATMENANGPFAFPGTIQTGDVVRVSPDTIWKERSWYAYVQGVRRYRTTTRIDVLWLYGASDTILGNAYYPFKNELFLSDHCECGERTSASNGLDAAHVLGKVDVAWFSRDPYKETGLFVRKKYRTIDETTDFVNIESSDFRCSCKSPIDLFQECVSTYYIGDTVLIKQQGRLLPALVCHFDHEDERVLVQKFAFDGANARPNQISPDDVCILVTADKVIRKCHVQIFEDAQIQSGDIPCPYDRDGAGDHFFTSNAANGTRVPIRKAESTNGDSESKSTGLGLFCGGGTFDRGLEEGGVVNFQYAVDWNLNAIHSYRANLKDPASAQLFYGSVNDYLARALGQDAKGGELIPLPGRINVISAGSPCPGFSRLQKDLNNPGARRNASMVASVVAFVDFYAPEYFILENVATMCQAMGANKDEFVFQQIAASLVALGYQVQALLADAWSYGDAQSRSRVFIIATAPGLTPWEHPPITHSHPQGTKLRALGVASNGCKFGVRRDDFATFQFTSASRAVRDLPSIWDTQVQICPAFPDHRAVPHENNVTRLRIKQVPVRPHGMGLMQMHYSGVLRGEAEEYCLNANQVRGARNSRAFSRILPNHLFPTITTVPQLHDGFHGRWLHWQEHRKVTVMELRRAQGYPDDEVLIGAPKSQMRIVGNSVDRKVALVLGLALRDSWRKSRRSSTQMPRADSAQELTKHMVSLMASKAIKPNEDTIMDNGYLDMDSNLATEREDQRSDDLDESRALGTIARQLPMGQVERSHGDISQHDEASEEAFCHEHVSRFFFPNHTNSTAISSISHLITNDENQTTTPGESGVRRRRHSMLDDEQLVAVRTHGFTAIRQFLQSNSLRPV